MASQRITIAKLAGLSGDIALQRLSAWSSERDAANPNLWSPEQWPEHVRQEADEFAERIREHGYALPVCHFVEWADMWSMGDLFSRLLTPPNHPKPIGVHANRFEVFAYGLPDDGQLANYLATAGPQQFAETDWFAARLLEAVSGRVASFRVINFGCHAFAAVSDVCPSKASKAAKACEASILSFPTTNRKY